MTSVLAPPARPRDPRVDFFRGLALIFIFIDHIPDNTWSYGTLRNFGFADASEVFVLLSGYSAALAYGLGSDRGPIRPSFKRAFLRAGRIYSWHIAILLASAVLLYAAAHAFRDPVYVQNMFLQKLTDDPAGALLGALTLTYQPNQMNILPLYVVLMLWFPVMLLLFRRGIAPALVVSTGIWATANYFKINLPVNTAGEGWFFNPFAWQLLFTTGAAAAVMAASHELTKRGVVLSMAIFYVSFSFLYAAPWVPISWLPNGRVLPPDLIGTVSKPDLSAWRFLHVLALAYLAGSLIPGTAAWLHKPPANVISLCGRNALEIFALGTFLSFAGWIVIRQLGTSAVLELGVSAVGIAAMVYVARLLSERKAIRSADPSVAG
jgi:hypothetical protein